MTHVRTQIREAAKLDLTGLPTTADRVLGGRARALGDGHEPTLLIYSLDEPASLDAMGPKQRRDLLLRVEGRVQTGGADDPEDELDQIAAEVEATLLAPGASLLALVQSIELSRTQINIQAAGKSINGSISMDFSVVYRTGEGAPTTAV